jgi:GH25 family lysozyme M1 (1,4-beta-N-acetylmuramidase)
MTNSHLAFGIDISRYNTSPDGKKKVDFDVIAAHDPEVVFIAMRAGISWGYADPWFRYYMQEAMRILLIRVAYHVLYPGRPAQAQMDNFFRILGDDLDLDVIPLVLDLELDHGISPIKITQVTADCLNIMHKRTGQTPWIYSRAGWVNQFLRVAALPPVFWWLAQYRYSLPYPLFTPEYPAPPTLPQGVNHWHIHQTSCRGAGIGTPGAYFMDYNRFNGTKTDFLKLLGKPAPKPIMCPVDNLECPRIFA